MITDDSLKKELGNRIKKLRIEQGLSRADVCGDEVYVSSRQLARIEQGEHLLKVSIALYLAEIFQVSVEQLLNPVPERYYQLKAKAIHFATQGDKKQMEEREDIIRDLYTYYNILPKQEKESIDLLDITAKLLHSGETQTARGYFFQFLKRPLSSVTDIKELDLLWIDFYFIYISIDESCYNEKIFNYTEFVLDYHWIYLYLYSV